MAPGSVCAGLRRREQLGEPAMVKSVNPSPPSTTLIELPFTHDPCQGFQEVPTGRRRAIVPYPMFPAPTFGELKQILIDEFDCRFIDGPRLSRRGSDESFIATYFSRTVEGREIECIFLPKGDEERMLPDVIRYICDSLEIPKERFGLNLG